MNFFSTRSETYIIVTFQNSSQVRSLFVWCLAVCKMFKNHFNGFQMTLPKFKLRNYRFFWVLLSRSITVLKHLYLYKFSVRKVLRFAIENDWMTWYLGWRPGTLLHVFGLKTLPIFLRFCYLNIPCLRMNITLIFLMRSSTCIGNSMICSDIWHKYHEWYFKIVVRNFTSR